MVTTPIKPIGFTTQLRDQIEYPAAGARRKVIVKDEKRQAVLICLAAGTELKSHKAGHDGLITVIEGQGIFTLEGQAIKLEPGVLIDMAANAVHAVKATTDLAFLKVVESHDDCQHHGDHAEA